MTSSVLVMILTLVAASCPRLRPPQYGLSAQLELLLRLLTSRIDSHIIGRELADIIKRAARAGELTDVLHRFNLSFQAKRV